MEERTPEQIAAQNAAIRREKTLLKLNVKYEKLTRKLERLNRKQARVTKKMADIAKKRAKYDNA